MPFPSQEKMLAKAAESARTGDNAQGQPEPPTSQGVPNIADAPIPGQEQAPLHLEPSPGATRVPTPPPQYEEVPPDLNVDVNRDAEAAPLVHQPPTRPTYGQSAPHAHGPPGDGGFPIPPVHEHHHPKEVNNAHHPDTLKKRFWRTKRGIILLLVFTNVIILAAVLGGVLGSRAAVDNGTSSGGTGGAQGRSSSSARPSPQPSRQPTATNTPRPGGNSSGTRPTPTAGNNSGGQGSPGTRTPAGG